MSDPNALGDPWRPDPDDGDDRPADADDGSQGWDLVPEQAEDAVDERVAQRDERVDRAEREPVQRRRPELVDECRYVDVDESFPSPTARGGALPGAPSSVR